MLSVAFLDVLLNDVAAARNATEGDPYSALAVSKIEA